MIRAAAILLLLTAPAMAADPYAGCGGRRYAAMQGDLPCARSYRGHRYFPVFVQTPAGLGVSLCWGRSIELDGNLWCKVPTR